MWAALKSLGNWIAQLFLKAASIKFVILTAIYWLMMKLYEIAKSVLGNTDWFTGLPAKIQSLPSDFLFYLQLFKLDVGLPMIFAAYLIAFAIRRLPIIG